VGYGQTGPDVPSDVSPQVPSPGSSTAASSSWSRRVSVGLVLAVTGLILTTAGFTSQGTDLRGRASNLPDLVRSAEQRNAGLQAEASQLQATVDSLAEQRAQGAAGSLLQRAKELAGPAQVAAVTGAGVVVALDDAPRRVGQPVPVGYTADDLVVHQQDVQAVVNALWRAGASAMTLMDQRVISTTAIRCVGNTLLLQGRVYSPPYKIAAIGESGKLLGGLDRDPTVRAYLQYVDLVHLGWQATPWPKLELPASAATLTLRWASAAPTP